MAKRRDVLKLGLATAGASLIAHNKSMAQLVFPDGELPSIVEAPSPPATPFVQELFRMPVAQPVDPVATGLISGPDQIDPLAHQRYGDFPPQRYYIDRLQEFTWQYHPEPPYDQGSWSWGFNGITPGPTYRERYDVPIHLRRINELPDVGMGNVNFALPSTTIHLHNAHTASESDGIPQDFFQPGQFWDHHYANVLAGVKPRPDRDGIFRGDPRETMSTLWYHDHRLDFTAPNVYAGLTGFYLLFDERDSDNENDRSRRAYRLPSGRYDIPMILHDVQFDDFGQVVWDFFMPKAHPGDEPMPVPDPTPDPEENNLFVPNRVYTTNGMLGDRFTVNRIIQPFCKVEPRKYRLRFLNGGPSRFYDLSFQKANGPNPSGNPLDFFVISTDGNLLPHPLVRESINISVAQRHDVIFDFSQFSPGDKVYVVNREEMRDDGAGPSGRHLDLGDLIMRFDVIASTGRDKSRIPDAFRPLPRVRFNEVRRHRTFVFDYDNGLWTINGQLMDKNRVDAAIEQGSAEIWTLRNAGNAWSHPIHTHFEEFQLLSKNGKAIKRDDTLNSRKDVLTLGPNDELVFFGRWRDFLGKHVMHCHNVVHEDHAMMIRWDIVEPGMGD